MFDNVPRPWNQCCRFSLRHCDVPPIPIHYGHGTRCPASRHPESAPLERNCASVDSVNSASNPVLADEARFSDLHYGKWADHLDLNAEMFRMYAKPSNSWHAREHMGELLQPVADRDVLDFGCGMGEE